VDAVGRGGAARMKLYRLIYAWVLWSQTVYLVPSDRPTEWKVIDGAESKQECEVLGEQMRAQRVEIDTDNLIQTRKGPNVWWIRKEPPLAYGLTFICLPETVDPRPRN
jgi:hypothetical protein